MKTQQLVIGSRVHSILQGGRDGVIYAIRGEQRPETCGTIAGFMVTGGNADFDIVWENGTESLCIPECLIKSSVQWRILDGVASAEEIASLRGLAILETQKRADEQAEKARQYREAIAALRANPQYSHLKQIKPNEYAGAAFAAANMRAELKKAFPGVKFSIRSKSFSGGDSIDVHWTDGPITSDVERIADKYSAGSFNGMEDLYEYSQSAWTAVFGDAKYVHCSRHHTVEALKDAVREVCMEYGWELFKVEESNGLGYIPSDNQDRYRIVYDYVEKRNHYRPN